jgi:hypothetical protein
MKLYLEQDCIVKRNGIRVVTTHMMIVSFTKWSLHLLIIEPDQKNNKWNSVLGKIVFVNRNGIRVATRSSMRWISRNAIIACICGNGTGNWKMKLYLGRDCIVERNGIRVLTGYMAIRNSNRVVTKQQVSRKAYCVDFLLWKRIRKSNLWNSIWGNIVPYVLWRGMVLGLHDMPMACDAFVVTKPEIEIWNSIVGRLYCELERY